MQDFDDQKNININDKFHIIPFFSACGKFILQLSP